MSRQYIPPELQRLVPEFLRVAQEVYDAWELDDEGYDWQVGSGGICHLIADEIAGVVSTVAKTCSTVSATHEVHVYTVAALDSGVWLIDIRPWVYETGGGYSWKKIPEVNFEEADLTFDQLSCDPRDFREFVDEGYEE
jgi:hypothetical protein